MECSCCGDYCPPLKQWPNRDNGYSVCRECVNKHPNWFNQHTHGIEGIHYESQEQYNLRKQRGNKHV